MITAGARVTLFRSEIFKYTPCLRVWLSSRDIFAEGGICCHANFFRYAYFSIVCKPFFLGGGRGELLEGKASSQPNNVSKHRNELFSKETLTNSCTVCHIITINMLKHQN